MIMLKDAKSRVVAFQGFSYLIQDGEDTTLIVNDDVIVTFTGIPGHVVFRAMLEADREEISLEISLVHHLGRSGEDWAASMRQNLARNDRVPPYEVRDVIDRIHIESFLADEKEPEVPIVPEPAAPTDTENDEGTTEPETETSGRVGAD